VLGEVGAVGERSGPWSGGLYDHLVAAYDSLAATAKYDATAGLAVLG